MRNEHGKLIKEHFNTKYEGYDARIRRLIPKYEEMHQVVIDAINFPSDKQINILDLGIGTGQTALELLKKFPNSKIDGVDIALNMMKSGKERLGEYVDRVKFIEKDMVDFDFGKKYDVCVAILSSIHHLNEEQKQIIFRKIFNSLNNGGIFVMGDLVEDKVQESVWKQFLIDNLGEKEGLYWFQNYLDEDLPSKAEDMFVWLTDVGFKKIEKRWEYMNYCVIRAQKRNSPPLLKLRREAVTSSLRQAQCKPLHSTSSG